MKLSILIFMSLLHVSFLWSASQVVVARKTKCITYDNIYIEACNRTIYIYEIESAHILEEISRLHTKLPIRCISAYKIQSKNYIKVLCRIGSIERECIYCVDNPFLPVQIN
jgi:hypothetical protein